MAVNAIAADDADAIVRLGRPAVLDCRHIPSESFPGCGTHNVLEGYSVITASPKNRTPSFVSVDVLSRRAYEDRLRSLFANVDGSFSDQHGGGEPTVLGVGKCGGSPSIAWTAGMSQTSEPAGRMYATLEFSLGDDGWKIDAMALYPPANWDALGPFADELLKELGCNAASNPWQVDS